MKKNLRILIPDAESGHTMSVVRCLGSIKGWKLHFLARSSNTALKYSFRTQTFKLSVNNSQNDLLIDTILKEAKKVSADIIFPVEEPAHMLISRYLHQINRDFKTPPISHVDTYHKSINKWNLAQVCKTNNIPCPRTHLLSSADDTGNILIELGLPLLAKPILGNGGIGILMIKETKQLEQFIDTHSKAYDQKYILQEYIEGYDIDCSLLAKDGQILAFTIQKGFISRSGNFQASAGIQFLYEPDVYEVVSNLMESLNFSGIAHIDLRYDQKEKKFKIIEINARYWGSLTGSLMAGINFPYYACLTGMGEQFETPKYKCIQYVECFTAIKTLIKDLFTFSRSPIKFKETDLKYLFSDPFAELLNVWFRTKKVKLAKEP
jgi:biotin carboxylase